MQLLPNGPFWVILVPDPVSKNVVITVLRIMNHPGVIFTVLWLLVLGLSPSVLQWKRSVPAGDGTVYVCPPCGCDGHNRTYELPGHCEFCDMPLITQAYPKVKAVEWSFFNEEYFSFFHHKLFYPAYFLAILLSMLAIWPNRKDRQSLFFIVFFLAYILYAFKSQLAGTGHSMHLSQRWYFFPGTFLLAAGPALWLYARNYGASAPDFTRKEALHFLPAFLVVLVMTTLFLGKPSWRYSMVYNSFDPYPAWAEQLVFIFSGSWYGWRAGKEFSDRETTSARGIRWGRYAVIAHFIFVMLWALMLSLNFALYHATATSLEYHWIWLYTALFALAGSYLIIFRKALIFPPVIAREKRLEEATLQTLKDRLLHLMQDQKPYLDPELNLQGLADLLDIKEKELSELLNTGLDTNFYQFVNQYRLEAVKALLLDPDKQHLTNMAIAEEAGFASRSSFFSLFKKHVGTTPGAFKKIHGN